MNELTEAMHVDSHSIVAAAFTLRWNSALAKHTEVYHSPRLNVWRDLDLLPAPIQQEILRHTGGHSGAHSFGPGVLVPAWSERNLVRVRDNQFNRNWRRHMRIEPYYGRYYPKGILEGVAGVFRGDMHPARLVDLDEGQLTFDCNHPLSRYPAQIEVEIGDIHPAGEEHGGRCNDVLETLLTGPGMQVRSDQARRTDFFSEGPFRRMDSSNDALFYAMPRMLNHLDAVAQVQVRALYARLLRPGSQILDLMSSFNSHLPDDLLPARVTGLGMNEEELKANPVLGERVVHDLNQAPKLPFEDACFDAAICTVSVEYLTDPFAVFREIARILRPGGLFVLPISNRWFPPKVINLWHNLHEFERPGLVLEYFLESGAFEGLETFSARGLSRPEDDLHIQTSLFSDPIHAVWGRRRPD